MTKVSANQTSPGRGIYRSHVKLIQSIVVINMYCLRFPVESANAPRMGDKTAMRTAAIVIAIAH